MSHGRNSEFKMKVGDTVVLSGMKQLKLNSKLATIVRKDDFDSWIVELDDIEIGVRQGQLLP